MSFKLDLTGRFVVEDDGEAHPTHWTLAEAKARQGRLEAEAVKHERAADTAQREGRTLNVEVHRAMVSYHAGKALELFRVLQSATQKESAA